MTPADGPAPGDDLESEVARLRDLLDAERRTSEQWRRVAEERRVAMERLRQRRVVRWLFAVAKVVLPPVQRLRHRLRAAERRVRRVGSGVLGARHRLSAPRREAALRRAVEALPAAATDDRSVTAIVLTRDGREHLERLLPALRRTRHPHLEVVVVDNASGPDTSDWLGTQSDVVVLRNDSNLSFSEANDRAVRATSSDVVLFLNDDVEPLDGDWLGRMLASLTAGTGAVGAQLVYPRRGLLDGRQRDVGVQHLGIALRPDGDGPPRAVNVGEGSDPDPVSPARAVAAATAACLLVDRGAYEAVGGFDFGYQYGAEDVDLCWRLRASGLDIVVQPAAVLWHREGATRHREAPEALARRQAANWDRLADLHGPAMRRAVDRDRIGGTLALSDVPLRVGITVTRDLESAGYGDWYTAHELGAAVAAFGWDVRYVERYRDAWYEQAADLDVVFVLHDVFDVRRLTTPGCTTVAWVRNWTDRWVGHPWFDDLDVVVASTEVSAEWIRANSRHRDVPVLPLATNDERFRRGEGARDGAVLTANHWGEDRGIAELAGAVPGLRLHGKGWDEVPAVASAWQGVAAYDDLPAIYGAATVVVDQTAAPTRRWGALNSRVFDALAAGALPVTDQVIGSDELFDGDLPTYEDPAQLGDVVRGWLADPEGAVELAGRLRDRVVADHTYRRRAEQFRDLLLDRRGRASFVVRIGAPNRREAANWGDTHYAEALVAELRGAGHHAITQTLDEWSDRRGRGFDVSVHLKGRSRCPRGVGQTHVVWVISHPDEVDPDELAVADLVLVASEALADDLRGRVDVPVQVMLQATDERRFRPTGRDESRAHPVVFVGNSRFVERPIVRDALAGGLPLSVYGANWDRFLPPTVIADTFVPNDELARLYSSADVVLNDHWPDMRRWGLVSNRVFDVLACGGCVVSDDSPGIAELFGDAVACVSSPEELTATVEELLADAPRRAAMGAAGRELVLGAHTFRHRADALLEHLAGLGTLQA